MVLTTLDYLPCFSSYGDVQVKNSFFGQWTHPVSFNTLDGGDLLQICCEPSPKNQIYCAACEVYSFWHNSGVWWTDCLDGRTDRYAICVANTALISEQVFAFSVKNYKCVHIEIVYIGSLAWTVPTKTKNVTWRRITECLAFSYLHRPQHVSGHSAMCCYFK